MLPLVTYNIKLEVLLHLKGHITYSTSVLDDLGVGTGATLNDKLDNHNRKFIISVPYGDTNYTFIALNHKTFSDHICDWIGNIKEIYIVYCNDGCLSIDTSLLTTLLAKKQL